VTRKQALLQLAGHAFSVSFARFAGIAITSLTFPFLVRKLQMETYGLWSYVISVTAFLDIVANPGLTTYLGQQLSARRSAAFDLVADVLTLRGLGTLLAAVVLFIVAKLDPHAEVRRLLIFYGLGVSVLNMTSTDYLLNALEKFHERSLLALAQQLLYAAGVFTFIRKPSDVIWIPISILGSALCANIAGWVVLARAGLRPRLRWRPAAWKPIMTPSLHYAFSTLMSSSYHRTGHLVVRWFLGEEALGIYSVGVRFVDILRNIVTTALSVLAPKLAFAAQSPARFLRIARAAVSATALVSFPTMLGTMATAGLVVPLVLGRGSAQSAHLIQWMSPYVVTATAASLFSGMLYSMGLYKQYMRSTVVGAVTGILLFFALTKMFGVVGAGVAFFLAEFAVALTSILSLPHEFRSLSRNSMILTAAGAALLMFACVELLMRFTTRPVVVVLCGVLVYCLATAAFVRKWWSTEILESAEATR
jgi:O-antigen/teichoic acid export membrane protein